MKKLGLTVLGTSLVATNVLGADIQKVYSIQLGAFSKKENAERALRSLPEELKKEAFIYVNEKGFYTLRVGKAKSYKDLLKEKALLKRYKIKGFVSKTLIAKEEKKTIQKVSYKKHKTKKVDEKVSTQAPSKFYSIQLGAFSTEYNALKFIKNLPEDLRNQAFVYKNRKGFYTVRIGKVGNTKLLKPLKALLRRYGFKGFIVKTEVKQMYTSKEETAVVNIKQNIKNKEVAAVSSDKIVSKKERVKPKKLTNVYSILVAIATDKEIAKQIADEYTQKFSLKTFIKEKYAGLGKKEYYVYLGEFPSENEAKEFMEKNLNARYPIEIIETKAEEEIKEEPNTANTQENIQKVTNFESPKSVSNIEKNVETKDIINQNPTPIFSILVQKTQNKEEAQTLEKSLKAKFPELKVFLKETIIGFKQKEYLVYLGEFTSFEEARKFAHRFGVKTESIDEIVYIKIDDSDLSCGGELLIKEEARDSLEPVVENRLSPEGTPENRRAEITVIPFSASAKEIDLSKYIDKGIYILNIWFPKVHYLEKIYDVALIFKPPKGFSYVLNSALLNDKHVYPKKIGKYYVVNIPEIKGSDEIDFKLQFLVKNKIKLENMPVFLIGKDQAGHPIKIYGFDKFRNEAEEALKIYESKNNIYPASTKKAVVRGIVYPEKDLIQVEETTDIVIDVPKNARYFLYVNGKRITKSQIGEEVTKGNIKTIKYVGIKLQKGENQILLKIDGKEYKRKITVSDEVTKIRVHHYPEKPEADGKTPVYVSIELLDKDGVPIKDTTFVEVYVDKGDIWDETTGQWITVGSEPLKVKAYSGKAVVKLSPASSTEERRLKIFYGEIEKEYTVRFYPEKRPWIVVGNLEGGIGIGDTKNNPQQTKMPFKHKDGTRLEGKGSVFAKGSVKDYTVTLRYQTEKPDNVLMNQNIPSTEENQYYPVYGDDSEQYFEARSKNRLFLKVEKDLSYLMFGDYTTNIGSDLEFNRYNRTFNGLDINLQKEKNYRVQGFITKNGQEQLKEEFQGKGISGPYFFKNPVRPYSERVWIETRDRFNSNIIIKREELHRFTDYTINYEEGFIIFHEPIKQYDDNFNPIYIVTVYETDDLQEEKYTYGLRGEKSFFNGKLRFGLTGIKEEHVLTDKKLYGADVLYETDKLRLLGEISRTETDNDGIAGKLEGRYAFNQYFSVGGYYKKVKEGYQNLSAITADQGYETYGANITATTKDGKTRVTAEGIVENRDIDRKTGSLILDHKVNEKFSFTLGGRIHKETNSSGTDTRALAVAGLTYKPTEKLSLSLRREQAINKDVASAYYPTRTIGRIDYRFSNWFSSYLQSEYQERADKDISLTTLGFEGRLKENTTAFSKYTIDDGASGWRTQSHIGLNHLFKITDKLTGDISVENVNTFSGEDTGDYTALAVRGAYLQNQRYKLSAGYEIRFGDFQPSHLLTLGGITKIGKAGTLLLRERYFKNEKQQNDLLLGFAYRPVDSDVWNSLFKLRWKYAKGELYNNKYIGSLHLNVQPNRKLRTAWQYAFKYTSGGSLGSSFIDLYRGRFSYDITDRIDIGAHGGVLWDHRNKNYSYAYGPEVGYTLFKNFWISLGYNVQGFHDEDFDEANYWAKGAYLKFRLKFDEDLFKKFFNEK